MEPPSLCFRSPMMKIPLPLFLVNAHEMSLYLRSEAHQLCFLAQPSSMAPHAGHLAKVIKSTAPHLDLPSRNSSQSLPLGSLPTTNSFPRLRLASERPSSTVLVDHSPSNQGESFSHQPRISPQELQAISLIGKGESNGNRIRQPRQPMMLGFQTFS